MNLTEDREFAVWAFGETAWDAYLRLEQDSWDLLGEWNELHGDLLILRRSNGLRKYLTQMKQIWREQMDKKMAKVTKSMKTASRDIKEGKKEAAVKTLKGAEKKNVKLTKIDREVRDPEIKAYKKMKQKGC